MPTAGRLIRRLDGRLYRNADGHLMRWKSGYNMDVKIYFGEDLDEQLRIDFTSTYFDPSSFSFEVDSGDTLTLTSSAVRGYGYYTTSATQVYNWNTSSLVTVATGARWEVQWQQYIDMYNITIPAVYWSTVGVWGPYYTDASFFLTTMNFSLTTPTRTRTGVTVPSVMHLRPT